MKLTLNYCTINDVMMVDPKKGDDQKKNRKVILHVDEEDFFDMLDSVNPKNIIKYLDMRGIQHREPSVVNLKVGHSRSTPRLRHKIRYLGAELHKLRQGENLNEEEKNEDRSD